MVFTILAGNRPTAQARRQDFGREGASFWVTAPKVGPESSPEKFRKTEKRASNLVHNIASVADKSLNFFFFYIIFLIFLWFFSGGEDVRVLQVTRSLNQFEDLQVYLLIIDIDQPEADCELQNMKRRLGWQSSF